MPKTTCEIRKDAVAILRERGWITGTDGVFNTIRGGPLCLLGALAVATGLAAREDFSVTGSAYAPQRDGMTPEQRMLKSAVNSMGLIWGDESVPTADERRAWRFNDTQESVEPVIARLLAGCD